MLKVTQCAKRTQKEWEDMSLALIQNQSTTRGQLPKMINRCKISVLNAENLMVKKIYKRRRSFHGKEFQEE